MDPSPTEPTEPSVFVMMRFADAPQLDAISSTIASTLAGYGLHAVRADRHVQHGELWSNLRGCMQASEFGIAVLDSIGGQALNANVCLELGYMLALDKPCLLLCEQGLAAPADLAGHLTKEFDAARLSETVDERVREWLRELGIARRRDERLLIFVSHGGTCRDPIAKAITLRLLHERPTPLKVRVEALAAGTPSSREASPAAREVVRKIYGRDLLTEHVARQITPELEREADLVLVMARSLLNHKSEAFRKTETLKGFFGIAGDVDDPYPGNDTKPETLERYMRCFEELTQILDNGFEQLLHRLEHGPSR